MGLIGLLISLKSVFLDFQYMIFRFYDSNFSTGCDGFQKNGWKSACVCCKSCMKYKAASDILQLNLTLMGKKD